MADLFSTLSMAARALEAQRFGLDVTGQNIANVNTPGYSRRVADFAALPPTATQPAGQGVEVQGVRATRDVLIERRLRDDLSLRDWYSASADILAQVEAVVGLPGQSLDTDMIRFFDAFANLAQDPISMPLRQQVVLEGQSLGLAFRNMAGRLEDAQRQADAYARQEVATINELAARIAELNRDMAKVPSDREPLHEMDATLEAINELAQHLDVVVVTRGEDRGLDLYFGSGRPLVVGETAYSITAVPTGPSGYVEIEHEGVTVTSEIALGRLAGYLNVRDVAIPDYVSRLDELAFRVAEEVNALHDAGFDLNGSDAGNFFTPLGAMTGAASLLSVDAGIVADPSLVAAAGIAAPGDNQVARAIAGLGDQPVMTGGTSTFHDFWGQLSYQVGRDAHVAVEERDNRAEAVRLTQAARDAVSGVSLDEEALQMTRFQRAYEANAVLFRTVDETIETLMRMVGA